MPVYSVLPDAIFGQVYHGTGYVHGMDLGIGKTPPQQFGQKTGPAPNLENAVDVFHGQNRSSKV
jgi:hypothetical protein